MKKVMIVATVAFALLGLATATQAHRDPQAPLECPSVKDWAKCLWQDIDRNSGG